LNRRRNRKSESCLTLITNLPILAYCILGVMAPSTSRSDRRSRSRSPPPTHSNRSEARGGASTSHSNYRQRSRSRSRSPIARRRDHESRSRRRDDDDDDRHRRRGGDGGRGNNSNNKMSENDGSRGGDGGWGGKQGSRDRSPGRPSLSLPSQASLTRSSDERGGGGDKPVTQVAVIEPNFKPSGALAAETNTFQGVVLKYNEPPEARKPVRNWRLYVFKGKEQVGEAFLHLAFLALP
jgi:smad nuclear-interacting protein 1